MRQCIILTGCLAVLFTSTVYAQSKGATDGFPLKITGYFGLVHPVATLQNSDIKMNFDNSYSVGFVSGISFQKNPKFGYSLEIVSMIEATSHSSTVKNIVIQPGVYFPLKGGWTITNRFSFETNGRYGITPSVGKVLVKGNHPVSLTLPLPMRIGNEKDFSIGTAVLFTVGI
ncbi:hypothetical protein BCY91_16690 [Pelobium manganitolerans]|uniref:Outer membrane protein beta-barrel domain-containing protein n=1 Tax=Pelobium manganitolerans TaxID=1842495 RepID=A0A419S7S6_9SPHI|nr:hypothetical protein [Pelobium manganitolerans]RKD17637.1 hypothetical protein BCY91_16690 [Pelobium manganitolerans]